MQKSVEGGYGIEQSSERHLLSARALNLEIKAILTVLKSLALSNLFNAYLLQLDLGILTIDALRYRMYLL